LFLVRWVFSFFLLRASFSDFSASCLPIIYLRICRPIVTATASIDRETDRFIQKMIRSSFDGVTILTIAHRLNTIMDFDRILVFDDGKIKEFDTPTNLLEKEGGSFRAMVEATGAESARVLRDIAQGDMDALALENDITMDQVNEAPAGESGDAESKSQ
jgi:ABC-type multidrug transport system ATPase subunit